MITNKIKLDQNEFIQYEMLNLGYDIESIKELFYPTTSVDNETLENYLIEKVVDCLINEWQYSWRINDLWLDEREWPRNGNYIHKMVRYLNQEIFDGYSQVLYHFGNITDSQCYDDGYNVFLFIANVYGGVATVINKITHNVKFFIIGEDDGSWFVTAKTYWGIEKQLDFFKREILSEINELHIENFNHQEVIKKIFNMNEFDFIPIDKWTKI